MTRLSPSSTRDFLFDDRVPILIEENGRKGLKMSDGEIVISPIYDTIEQLRPFTTSSYLYKVVKDGKCGMIDVKHDKVVTRLDIEYSSFQWLPNDDLLLCKNGKYGVWDWHIYVPCEYDEIIFVEYEKKQMLEELEWNYHDNYLLLRKGNKYGLWSIDTRLLPAIYDEIAPPIDDWGIRVNMDGKWGYLDKNHNFTTDISEVPLKWDNLDDVSGGICF